MRPKTDFFFVHASLKIVLALVSLAAGDGKNTHFRATKTLKSTSLKKRILNLLTRNGLLCPLPSMEVQLKVLMRR